MQQVAQPGFRRDELAPVEVEDVGPVPVVVYRRDPIEPDAPPHRIVIAHGLGDAPVSWFPCLRAALPRHELVLPALPGAGRGPLPDGVDHLTNAQSAAWMLGCLRAATADDVPTVVVGHSLGGWLVSRAMLADSSLVDRVGPPILVNNAGTWYDGVERERDLLSPKRLEDVEELMDHLYAKPRQMPIVALQALLDTMQSPAYQGLLWSTDRPDFLAADDVERLPAGTGLLWGVHDRLVPEQAYRTLREHLQAPHVVELPECGHAPHVEDPAGLVSALEDLMSRR